MLGRHYNPIDPETPAKLSSNYVTTKKPTVSIIGPGRLGTALGIALKSAGYQIVSVVRRRKAGKAADFLDAPIEAIGGKVLAGYRLGDLVVVAVPDDRIPEVADALVGIEPKRRAVLHTSGAVSSEVFAHLKGKGWRTGSIHPLVSISDPVTGAELLRKAFWCVEGDSIAARLARRVVRDLGGQSFSIDSKDKPLYHAAAVMSSGNVVALFAVALDMLERCGIPRKKAQKILLPLVDSTVANLSRFDPRLALTGPFARGDLATVERHLETLKRLDLKAASNLYRILGHRSLELVEKRMSPEISEQIKRRLRSASKR